jgi:hypothetical protein
MAMKRNPSSDANAFASKTLFAMCVDVVSARLLISFLMFEPILASDLSLAPSKAAIAPSHRAAISAVTIASIPARRPSNVRSAANDNLARAL